MNKAEVDWLLSGPDFFKTAESLISRARTVLHLQVYIFDYDQTGMEMLEQLEAASARGVSVYLLLDDFGSAGFAHRYKERCLKSGIRFRMFGHLTLSSRHPYGRRLHHKLIVADRQEAILGGINIADKYKGVQGKPWLDFGVHIAGEPAVQLHEIAEALFNKQHVRLARIRSTEYGLKDDHGRLLIRRNDWLVGRSEISRSYREAVSMATHDIMIVASYFLPGRRIKKRLEEAAARGVRIRFVMSSVSDIPLMRAASRFLYRWMMKSGMEIYEYQPGVVHGKVALVDDRWITVGSYNLNHLSDYGSLEMNVEVDAPVHVKVFSEHLQGLMDNQCVRIRSVSHGGIGGHLSGMTDWLSYILMKAAESLLLFFTGKRKSDLGH